VELTVLGAGHFLEHLAVAGTEGKFMPFNFPLGFPPGPAYSCNFRTSNRTEKRIHKYKLTAVNGKLGR
jgi:hypothetical protein